MIPAAIASVAGMAFLLALIRGARGPRVADRVLAARMALVSALVACAAVAPDVALALAAGALPLSVAAGRRLRRGALHAPLSKSAP
jgi:multisubunit Na+/H+ antiporter MnhF subunit